MSDVGCDVADTASDDSAERGNEEEEREGEKEKEEKEERGRVGGREVAAGRVWRRGNSKDKNSRGWCGEGGIQKIRIAGDKITFYE